MRMNILTISNQIVNCYDHLSIFFKQNTIFHSEFHKNYVEPYWEHFPNATIVTSKYL